MKFLSSRAIFLISLFAAPLGFSQHVHWTDCPSEHPQKQEELVQRRGIYTLYSLGIEPNKHDTILPEPLGPFQNSPRLRFGRDSYPRQPATFLKAPEVTRHTDGRWAIRFALDRPDDVTVRVVDAQGEHLHLIASGVVGLAKANPPLQENVLFQTIYWDGKNLDGEEIPNAAAIKVQLGLKPEFDRFLGYDPGQFTRYLNGLQVDWKGYVYASLATHNRSDPMLLRFDREGNYREMVYPSSIEVLKRLGKELSDVYEHVEMVDGKPVPVLQSLWRTHFQRFEGFLKLPFIIDKRGMSAFFVESMHSYSFGTRFPIQVAHAFPVELDNFFFKPYNADGEFGSAFTIPGQYKDVAIGPEGNLYILNSRLEKMHNSVQLQDWDGFGTVTKVDPVTLRGVKDFTHNGTAELESPSYHLGTPGNFKRVFGEHPRGFDYEKVHRAYFEEGKVSEEPIWEKDNDQAFLEPEELDVDDAGNIMVIDGLPRRVKMYANNGKWIGELKGVTMDGTPRRFFDLISLYTTRNATYLLSSFIDEPEQVYLLKMEDITGDARLVWSVPLAPQSRFVAVEKNWGWTYVWVGNGNGEASMTRIEDLGDQPGEPMHVGGIKDGTFVDPWAVELTSSGEVFVYDYDRHAIVKTDLKGESWQTVDADVPSKGLEYNAKYRRWGYGYDTPLRGSESTVLSLCADEERQQLWVSYDTGMVDSTNGYVGLNLSKGYDIFNWDLESVDINLEEHPNRNEFDVKTSLRWPFVSKTVFSDVYGDHLFQMPVTAARPLWQNKTPDSEPVWMSTSTRSATDGSLTEGPKVTVGVGNANMTVDSRGNIYVADLVPMGNPSRCDALFGFPNHDRYFAGYNGRPDNYHFYRGDEPVTHQSQIIEVVKFGPEGGKRLSDQEQWTHRGAGFINNFCGDCNHHLNLLSTDDGDHLFAGDPIHHGIRILDPAGHMIQWIGQYGNADQNLQTGDSAKGINFHNIFMLSAAGKHLAVVDRDLKRIALIKMNYREQVSCPLQ